ncbi:War1p PWA37_003165 [Arxiozyma heterogenica]|uniref:Zn(2)-C6 fungal-type domain-containing protein n=1 Tax=Arxiozyma heterogenica TaxID=278026 RepID=A0AAN7WL60_9SACH|nr:hypothetical protein RI543_001653 [Kazachstania heterogenica]
MHIYTEDNTDLCTTVIQGILDDDPRILGPTNLKSNTKGKSKRNTFACVRCHSLKQKCVPSDPNDIYRKPCVRCLKREKKCTFDLAKRTRKRRARTPINVPDIGDRTSPIDSTSSVNSNSIESSSITQYSATTQSREPYMSTPITNSVAVEVAYDPTSTLSTDRKNDNTGVGNHINKNTNIYQSNFPLDSSENIVESNNTKPYQSAPQNTMKIDVSNQQHNSTNINQFSTTFLPIQMNSLTKNNLLNNEKYYTESTNADNNVSSGYNPVTSQENLKQPSTQIVNSNNQNISNICLNSTGLDLLQTAIFSNQDTTKKSSNELSNEITTVNHAPQKIITPSTTTLNIQTSSDRKEQPTTNILNKHKELAFMDKPTNKSNISAIAVKKKTQYHMNHEFKRNLRSLLILLKGKVSGIFNKFNLWSTQWNKLVENSLFLPTISDPVYLGIISMEEAELRLKLYSEVIARESRLPFVCIRDDASINDIRKDKPIFFSVVMSIVSKVMTEEQTTRDTVMKLDSFVINLITIQIFKLNNKSIEVIEALVTLCMWYNFLEWSNKTRYHLFNYICCCFLKDLSPASVNRVFGMFNDEAPNKSQAPRRSLLEQAENGPRLTLLVYISALNISIYLKQTIHVRWSFITENAIEDIKQNIDDLKACLEASKNTNDNTTSLSLQIEGCETLITFSKLNHLLEKIHIHLHEIKDIKYDEALSNYKLAEQYIQGLIDIYQKELDEVFKGIPNSRPRVLAFYYSVEAYLHQFTLNDYIHFEAIEKNADLPDNVTKAFLRCYECCTKSLMEFLKLSDTLIASLPLFHMSRIIYIVGVLILKLRYAAVSIPSFHHFATITDGTIDLVKQVSTSLESASRKYPYNNGLYKFQYVIALFGQTYATRVTELAERMEHNEQHAKMNKNIQFNTQLMYSEDVNSRQLYLNPMNLNTINNQINTVNNANFVPKLNNENNTIKVELSNHNNNSALNGDARLNVYLDSKQNSTVSNNKEFPIEKNKNGFPFQLNPLSGATNKTNMINDQLPLLKDSSPSIASDNLNEYLTDMNSLALGYDALNDEFWTDLLFSGM